MKRYIKMLAMVLVAGTLAACGGGGGSAGSSGGGTGGTGGGGGGGGGGTDDGSTATGTIQLAIVNSSGNQVSNIDSSGGFRARATVRNASGGVEAERLVTFSLPDNAIATVSPATALTNARGVAEVTLAPSSLNAVGAASLAATATLGTSTLLVSRDFGVSSSDLSLSAISLGSTNLPSGGNTSISVTALVNGSPSTGSPVNVSFTASCGRINSQGTSVSTTTNGSGVASATYTAVSGDGTLCTGPVTLNASSAGANGRTATVNVAAPAANAMTFVGADPAQIFIAGSGALEQSEVTFKVLSGTAPLANQTVTFSLTVNPGGVGLDATGSTADVTATTDAQGEASVSVFSGSIPGPLRVRAALVADPSVFSESQNLTVASGPPSQRFMSLSLQTYNIEGWQRDGVSTALTVRVADRQGNAVADGTVVNFTAEGGQVGSSCATTRVNGISACSVDFISQNPRPDNGRVSVLAYTNGTKDYVDLNGNNRFDAGDTLRDIGDPYRDDDENANFDAGEFLIPRGGMRACVGTGAPFPTRANTCDGQLATTVRQQATILYSSSEARFKNVVVRPDGVEFDLASRAHALLPMPAGTSLAGGTIDRSATNNLSCTFTNVTPSTVLNVSPGPDPTADLSTRHVVALSECVSGDRVDISATSPAGTITTIRVTIP